MKICEVYKCKRLALGMTQAEFANLVGVSGGTISRFELGEQLSPAIFNAIRFGVENYIRQFERQQYLQIRILEEAYKLQYEPEAEKTKTLAHLMIHVSKLELDLLNPNNEN